MRKVGLVLVALTLGTAAAPAGAGELNQWTPHEFSTAAPCAVACPYWLDTLNADLDGDEREDVHFDACGNPGGTDGSLSDVPGLPWEQGVVYDELAVGPPADGSTVLIVEAFPSVDWDLFICVNGVDATHGCTTAGREECVSGENCDNPFGPNNPVPVGCYHRGAVQSTAEITIRAYNFSDPFPLQIRYCWSSAGSCS